MSYLVTFHWGWLAGAALIGLAMGWIAVVQHDTAMSRATAQRIAMLVLALIAASVARIVPGRFGYWLDLGLLLFAAYLVGCTIGSWLRDRFMARQASSQGSSQASSQAPSS
jgi:hypothetical protein